MSILAHVLRIMPFSLDVGGRKTKWILRLGDAINLSRESDSFQIVKTFLVIAPEAFASDVELRAIQHRQDLQIK